MRRRYVYVRKDPAEGLSFISASDELNRDVTAPTAFTSPGNARLVGVESVGEESDSEENTAEVTTEENAAAAEAQPQPNEEGGAAGAQEDAEVGRHPRRARPFTLWGKLVYSAPADVGIPIIAQDIRRTTLWFYAAVGLDVLALIVLSALTLRREPTAWQTVPVHVLQRYANPAQLIFDPQIDSTAGPETARFSLKRSGVPCSNFYCLLDSATSWEFSTSALAWQAVVVAALHLLGVAGAMLASPRILSAYIGAMLAVAILRGAGGVFVSSIFQTANSPAAVDPGNAATFWLALRVVADGICAMIAASLRSRLSASWV